MFDNGPVPGRNDACWCGSGKKYKKCHSAFDERLERLWEEGWEVLPRTLYKTPADIEGDLEQYVQGTPEHRLMD